MHNIPKATIVLSNRCNLNCSYCFVNQNSVSTISFEQIKTFIKWFINLPAKGEYKKLNFFGGEPFLEFELLKDAILYFKKHNRSKKSIIDTIPTNGTIISQNILNFIKEENLRVSFSIDGDQLSNNSRNYKNGNNSFQKTLRNMRIFTDFIGKTPLVKMTILPSNVGNLFSNIKFLIKSGFYNLWPNPGVFNVKWEEKHVKIFIEEYKKILKYYLKNKLLKTPISLVPVEDIIKHSINGALKEPDFFCGLGEEPILSFDGNIYTCDSVLLGFKNLVNNFCIGNVTHNKVTIDFNKMNYYRKYNLLESFELKNSNHYLANLFKRRPCFALNEKGEFLDNIHIENILEIHIKMYELSLSLFDKYGHLLNKSC